MNLKKRWKLQRDLRKTVAKIYPDYDIKSIKVKKAENGDVLIVPFNFYADENISFVVGERQITLVVFSNVIKDGMFETLQEITLTREGYNLIWNIAYNVQTK